MKVKSQESRDKSRQINCGLQIADCGFPFNPKSEIRNPKSPRFPRRAMTLIELLVVIIILTTIVAAAIPIMAPSNDDRRLREAARGANAYISGAQARAISLSRPYGVALKRLSADTGRDDASDPDNDNGVCLEIFYAEQQPPFTGFDRNSRVCVAIHPTELGFVIVRFVTRGPPTSGLPVGWTADPFPPGIIRPGDVIEIGDTRFELVNHEQDQELDQYARVGIDKQTGYYVPQQTGTTVQIIARPINDTGQQIRPEHDSRGRSLRDAPMTPRPLPPYWTAPTPYRILRQPTFASDEPYQLPEGTAIDLRASGLGDGDYFYVPRTHDNADYIYVMFAPEGGVYRLSYNQNPATAEFFDEPVAENVYLLIGKRENIPAPLAASDPTLKAGGPPDGLPDATAPNRDQLVDEMREPINWLNGNSRWVVIGSQSGRIVTIENALVDPALVFSVGIAKTPPAPAGSEELRNEQIAAAREFTREMAQLGGR